MREFSTSWVEDLLLCGALPFLADGMGRSVVDGTQDVALGVLSRARGRRWKQTCASDRPIKCPRGTAGDKTTLKCLKRRFRPLQICVARIVLEHAHLVVAQRKIAAAHAGAHRETRKKNEDCS